MSFSLHFAARSDLGLLRDNNEDSAYASARLLVLADGVGGHVAGEVASSVAVASLAVLDDDVPGPDLLRALSDAVTRANDQLRQMIDGDPELEGMGTTLTALLRSGNRLGLAHIGDSRGYLLRDGDLSQITRDHTFVQTLVDEGRISADEAAHHPQRSLIMKALDGRTEVEPDLSVREARPGDRYLLCSDGLSDVVGPDTLRETLLRGTPDDACAALIQLALRGGGPDNVTCVVADLVEGDTRETLPIIVGAAATRPTPAQDRLDDSPAVRAAALRPPAEPTGSDEPDAERPVPVRRRWWLRGLLAVIVLAVLASGVWGFVRWSKTQYYVGADAGQVAIFRGLPQRAAGLHLSSVYQRQPINLSDLPTFYREQVEDTIDTRGLDDAFKVVDGLRQQAQRCIEQREAATPPPTAPGGTPAPPAATGSPRPSASAGLRPSPPPTAAVATTGTSPRPLPGAVDCGEATAQ